jgi:hypothetical protein
MHGEGSLGQAPNGRGRGRVGKHLRAMAESRRTVALTWWLFAGVILGGFPAIFGYIYVIVNHDTGDFTKVTARGDLLILAVVLAGGGLAQILAAERCLVSQFPLLKAWLAGTTLILCILGAGLYALAFNADWTHIPDFDYVAIAQFSIGLVVGSIVATGCCIVTTLQP